MVEKKLLKEVILIWKQVLEIFQILLLVGLCIAKDGLKTRLI